MPANPKYPYANTDRLWDLLYKIAYNTADLDTYGSPLQWSGLTNNGLLQVASPTTVVSTLTPTGITSINGIGLTSNSVGFAIAGGTTSKTLTVSNTLTLAGTDSTTMTFPTTSATIARTDASNTFTGHQTIEGVTSTGATGTGNLVFSVSPTFTGTLTAAAGSFTTLLAGGQITSQVTTGTAPFVVSSTTNVANLNASSLLGYTWASPSAIGNTAPAAGSFTTMSSSGATTHTSTTASTSTTTGAVVITGGVGVGGAINAPTINIGGVYSNTTYPFWVHIGTNENLVFRDNSGNAGIWAVDDGFGTYKNVELHGINVGLFYQNSAVLTVTSANGAGVTFNNYGTGAITSNAGVLSATSDERTKNIHGDFTRGLSALRLITPKLFNFKWDKTGMVQAGFIAQNVKLGIPEAVHNDQPDGMLTLSDRPILATVINAVVETDTEVQSLRKRVAELEAKLAK